MTKASALALMLLAGLMTGCDSSGGSSSTKTGVFHDAVVSGISYSTTSGKEGVTDANGKFSYKEGDSITFSIGSIVFPDGVPQDGIITPAHLAGTSDWKNSDTAINIIRFLLTLDEDGNPDNGIQIPAGAADLANNEIDFADNDAFNSAAGAFFVSLGNKLTYGYTEIVSNEIAINHFEDTIKALDIDIVIQISTSKLIGSWYYSDTESENYTEQFHIVLTFLDSNTYVIATDEADEEDDSGKDGFEIGSYTLSKEGVFEASVKVNNNGEWGFSHPCDNEVLTLEVDGDTLKLTSDGEVGEGCSGDGGSDVIELTRVKSNSNPMVGSWLLDIDLKNNKFALLTLLQDGGYMMVQNDTKTDGGEPGIERGYVLFEDESNPDAVIFDYYTDTNGQWGFSHPCAILGTEDPGYLNCGADGDIVQTLEVNDDTLTFISEADTIANDDVEDPVELVRVK